MSKSYNDRRRRNDNVDTVEVKRQREVNRKRRFSQRNASTVELDDHSLGHLLEDRVLKKLKIDDKY